MNCRTGHMDQTFTFWKQIIYKSFTISFSGARRPYARRAQKWGALGYRRPYSFSVHKHSSLAYRNLSIPRSATVCYCKIASLC